MGCPGRARGGLHDVAAPDVFLITVDTLRRDHVSAYNAASPVQTPAIDALADDSIRFTDAFSPISVTGPAFASAMTGLYPEGHGVMESLPERCPAR